MAKVTFYDAEMDWLLNNPSGTVGRWLSSLGRDIKRLAKAKVGVRTGALRASIHMRHFRDPRGQYITVGSDLRYALLHHEGSRPHVITPSRAKLLVFASKGQIIRAHRVAHPGTRANRYLLEPMITVVAARA